MRRFTKPVSDFRFVQFFLYTLYTLFFIHPVHPFFYTYYSCLGWQPCCTIVTTVASAGSRAVLQYTTAASAGSCVPYITIFCSTLKLIIRQDSDLVKYIKFSLNGVIDYSSILKFVFYKIFFTIRTTDTYQYLSNKFTKYARKARRHAR